MRLRTAACLFLACFAFAAGAAAKPRAGPPAQARGLALMRHLDMAMAIDAQGKALEAQLGAVSSRYATANSITPGSPYIGGSQRNAGAGNLRNYNETELEAGMPVWLPGQRDAYESTVTSSLREVEERLALRRLDVAALLRDAWWRAQRAARDADIARTRLATARDIGKDMSRRVELGESAYSEELLAKNEILAAETELAQVEASVKAARLSYATLTGGAAPDGALEGAAKGADIDGHPALRAPRASLERAEMEARLVEASPIDNPELGVFGRKEHNDQYSTDPSQQVTNQRTDSTTLGVRFRIPLPTPGRNEPKRAAAEAEVARAQADYDRAKRLVEAEIRAAAMAAAAARRIEGVAAKRLALANTQFELSRKSFQLGEASAVDLYRVRQSQLDAMRSHASAAIDVGVAASRLNQAHGYAP